MPGLSQGLRYVETTALLFPPKSTCSALRTLLQARTERSTPSEDRKILCEAPSKFYSGKTGRDGMGSYYCGKHFQIRDKLV